MPKTIVIGGSGHVGTYLVPRLVEAGHDVINVSRGKSNPYIDNKYWTYVETVQMDRESEEANGSFGEKIAALGGNNVIDMISFTLESTQQIALALRGKVDHFLHTGTIWVHGPGSTIPTQESDAKRPFGDYGVQKSEIEDDLLGLAKRGELPSTVIRPGHIVGPGWSPLNPAGHFTDQVFIDMAQGKSLCLPNFGLETVHHVHADDVAQMFMRALARPSQSIGEAFNAVSPAALTLRGYAEAMFKWMGQEPNLAYLPFDEWAKTQSKADAEATWEHISRSPCHSIEKGQSLLGYAPRYSSLQAVQESVAVILQSAK